MDLNTHLECLFPLKEETFKDMAGALNTPGPPIPEGKALLPAFLLSMMSAAALPLGFL